MKKTITVNIAAVAFSIDEDAYQMLHAYLEDISFRLKSQNEDSETMNDIETRIMEILKENGVSENQVINISNVKTVISIIGNPSVFGEGYNKSENMRTEKNYEYSFIEKKLMRDPDNKFIGGVCSGLGSYFNIDISLIRIIFVAFCFFGGLSFWIYIILWIIVPIAKSEEEKDMLKRSRRI